MRLPWSQIDLRWTPHLPGLAANPTTCAAAGRHRRSRTCEVHARYEAGTSPEAMSAGRQLEPGHAEQLSKTAASPHGAKGRVTPPTNARASRASSARPESVAISRTGTPVISVTPSRPPTLRENTGPPGGHTGMHARLGSARQAGTRRRRRPSVAVRGKPAVTPTVPAARTPSAMRPWMPQHSAQPRDKVTHHGIEKKRPANARIRS